MINKIADYRNRVENGEPFEMNGRAVSWQKTQNLKVGAKIAVTYEDYTTTTPVPVSPTPGVDGLDSRSLPTGVFFDEIVSIKKVGREHVYDIEVEATRNFVGNGIVAHNTYVSGNVGIGRSAPATKFGISGLTATSGTAVVVDANGDFYTSSSSRRYKDNIQDYSPDFAKIMEAQPKSYNYRATGAADIGFVAEDFDALGLKDLVLYDAEGRPDAIKYDRIAVYELEVLKKQRVEIESLKSLEQPKKEDFFSVLEASQSAAIANHEDRIKNQESRITGLESAVSTLNSKFLILNSPPGDSSYRPPVSLDGNLAIGAANATSNNQPFDSAQDRLLTTNSDLGITSVSDLSTSSLLARQGDSLTGAVNPTNAPKTVENFSIGSLPEGSPTTQEFNSLDPTIEAGDVVSLGVVSDKTHKSNGTYETNDGVTKSLQSGDENVLGVAEQRPQTIDPSTKVSGLRSEVSVVLLGKAKVKVTGTNGPIRAGEFLRSSSTPGYAEKATGAGMVLGKALEDYPDETHGNYETNESHLIPVLVNVSWFDPAAAGNSNIESRNSKQIQNSNLENSIIPSDFDIRISDLTATGKTSLADLTVAGNLLVSANLNITDVGIGTVLGDLEIQKNGRNGVKFFGGRIALTPEGNITTKGVIRAEKVVAREVQAGKVLAGKISVATTSAEIDKTYETNESSTESSPSAEALAKDSRSRVAPAADSGSLTPPPLDPTIGSSAIKAGRTSVFIANNSVTENSRIFVTATSSTSGQNLVVTEKVPGRSFTVAIDFPVEADIKFDWWLVN